MPRPKKRSPVGTERRRRWLERLEQDGESPPQIAQKDGFDIRTVRKQIEIARQERETREARSMVLRNALEKHYGDLMAFAKALEDALATSSLTSHLVNPLPNKSDRMWSALHEHLPRSGFWKDINRWERLCTELTGLLEESGTRLLQDLESKTEFKLISSSESVELLLPQLRSAVDDRLKRLVEKGPFPVAYLNIFAKQNGLMGVTYEGHYCATFPPEQETSIKDLITNLMERVGDLPEFASMQKMLSELYRIKSNIMDELAIIRLRRVVPGRCRYCPI